MNKPASQARLLTDEAAAAYLSLPVRAMRKLPHGRVMIDGRVRWDRVKLDEWLDGERRQAAQMPANENISEADAALGRFLADKGHAAGRP